MNCQRIKEEIKAYIDGELGPVTRLRVARHLRSCPECRREMNEMAELTKRVKSAVSVPAPQGLRDKILAGVDGVPAAAPRRFKSTYAFGAAAMVLVGIVAYSIVMPTFQRAREKVSLTVQHSERAIGKALPMQSAPLAKKSAPADAKTSPRSVPFDGDTRLSDGHVEALKGKRAAGSAPGDPEYFSMDSVTPAPRAAKARPIIIKTADMSIVVKDVQAAGDSATSLAKSVGGFVTDSSISDEDGASEGKVTLRVPVDAFERVIEQLGKLGNVESKNVSGQDVTGEVVDLESRLRNLRAEERQYLEIMNKANKVPDVVTVSQELYRVRGEIEESEGRMKYLKSAAAMATIDAKFSKQKAKPVPKSSIEQSFTNAVAALGSAGNALAGTAVWLAVFSPFWVLPLGAVFYIRRRQAAVEQR